MSFNKKVVKLLKEKKKSKAELAKAAGIPYTTLDSMLKRESDTSRLATIYKIAEYLGVSVEELVFDDCSTERHAVNLCSLLGKFCSAHGAATVEVMVVVVGVCCAREGVCSRLGDGVDTSTAETALSHIEGCRYNLNIRDCIERNGVGTCQAAIGARGGQTIHIVRRGAVNLEGVVARVCASNRNSAILRYHSLRSKAGDIVDRARNGWGALDQITAECHACSPSVLDEVVACNDHGVNVLSVGKPGIDLSLLSQR